MTRHTLGFALLVTVALSTSVYGRDTDARLILSGSQTEGSVTGGKTQSYLLRVADPSTLVFKIEAEAAFCRADITKRTQRSLPATILQFPASFIDQAVAGDVYTISFFQSRDAWVKQTGCRFTLSVNSQ